MKSFAKALSLSNSHIASERLLVDGNLPEENLVHANDSFTLSGTKNFTMSLSANPMIGTCSFPKNILHPGSPFFMSISVENRSAKKIFEISAGLNIHYYIHAKGETDLKKEILLVASKKYPGYINPMEVKKNIDLEFDLPPDLPPSVEGKLFKRRYSVWNLFFLIYCKSMLTVCV